MPLRIAFDLDGVLADMESELVRQAEVVFGESIAKRIEDPPRVTGSRATDGAENTARAELDEPSGANLTRDIDG